MSTAKCLPRRSVCVDQNVCVCLSPLMAMLAVMCLMEDKQHSLRQAFTAKRFSQHPHAECKRGSTLSPLQLFEHTHTSQCTSMQRHKHTLVHIVTVWIICLKAASNKVHKALHARSHKHTYTQVMMSPGDEFQS